MILSRHFWLGIGFGFFFASIFFASQALASTTDWDTSTTTAGTNFTDFTNTFWVNIPSGIISGDVLNQVVLRNQYLNKQYTAYVYPVGNTTTILATSTTANNESAFNAYYTFDFPTTTADCRLGCDIKITGSNGAFITQTSISQTIALLSPNTGTKPAIKLVSTLTPTPSSTSLVAFSFSRGDVASSSCVGSSTSSVCTHYYYPQTFPLSPFNLTLFSLLFALSTYSTYWIIRQLA